MALYFRHMLLRSMLASITLFSLATSATIQASDLAKEKRWADQVVDAIIDGEAVWLESGKHKFLGIYTEAADSSKRGAIIMHGTGVHPNWQQVIQPLRVGLAEQGWNTLSIQMPVLANEAEYTEYAPLYDEVPPRINAAIKYMADQGINQVYLVGHSQGSAMGAFYLRKAPAAVSGFVAVGMSVFDNDPRMNTLTSLQSIRIPILDLYGKDDLEGILKSADSRAKAASKAPNRRYQQKMIAGNHFFDGEEESLLDSVLGWLNTMAEQSGQ